MCISATVVVLGVTIVTLSVAIYIIKISQVFLELGLNEVCDIDSVVSLY